MRVAFLPPAFFRRAFFVAFLRAAILGFTPLVRLLDAPGLCVFAGDSESISDAVART